MANRKSITLLYEKKFACWSNDGSIVNIFEASVKHLSDEKMLDISVLNGDGTNTVAKKVVMEPAFQGTNIKKVKR